MSTAIVDYGVGNLGSIVSMHRRLGIDAELVSDPDELARHARFILPGVGAFDDAVDRLDASGMRPALEELVIQERRPLLGICLGMELLADSSEEGERRGLGWVPGRVRSMRGSLPAQFRLPFMGWGFVTPTQEHPLLPPTDEPQRFYFAHSYAFETTADFLLGTVDYGIEIAAVVGHHNVLGTQFHPEKSHRFGMALLRSFDAFEVS
ncbi:MAG: imidazole glycerol phosphate synthase subunit HisH [Ilumatobacter sp.]|nr:imidazole glycerol phosphate synthase subunit HisH [Ilumatobacter sp.]